MFDVGEWSFIIAGPNFEGLDTDPWFLSHLALGLLFVAAVVCAITHDFRMTMKHPPLKRGRLYQIAVWIIFSVALLLAVSWVIRPLLRS